MDKAITMLLVVITTTVFICVLYVLWAKKTPDATKKSKAVLLLIGVLLESFIGAGTGKIFDIVITSTTTQGSVITTSSTMQVLASKDSSKVVNTSDNSKNDKNNEAYSFSQSSLTTEKAIETEAIISTYETNAQSENDYTVFLSFEPIPFSFTDNNGDFRAYTSFEAKKVSLYCEVDGIPYGEFDMKTDDLHNWTYDACFFEPNTYVLTAVAEGPSGKVYSNSVPVDFPFT